MNANEITYGVELEVTVPVAARELFSVGGYHRGHQIAALPEGWNAQHDCSIGADAGFFGVEVVSPVLKGADGLRQVKLVCEWLQGLGAKVNRSTGCHVHVGFDRSNKSNLKKLVTLVARWEKALFASTGTHGRESSHFCQPIASNDAYVATFKNGRAGHCRAGRYHILNLTSEKPTVEFRCFAGTISTVKVVGHVLTCVGLVEKALTMKKGSNWTAKTLSENSGLVKTGAGETAVNRMFHNLGWSGGNQVKAFGIILDEVLPTNLPTVKEVKAELVRLAKKYDAAAV
jgi:hypothetical protein